MSVSRLSPPASGLAEAPRLSVVIPLYNCLALTQAMLESLRATLPSGLAHEIIFVDDGSTDGTREWLKNLSPSNGSATPGAPFRVVLNEQNLGYAVANNRGAALARGEFLVLLNNDLVLLPHWLEPMLAAHRALRERAGPIGNVQLDARTGAIDHAGIVINRQGKPEHARTLPPRSQRLFTSLRRVPAITGACLLIERALWQKLGGFDASFVNGGEDVDLCFRARAAGYDTAVALRSIVRHHVSSSAGRKAHDEQNSYRLARRWRAEFIADSRDATRSWCRDYLRAALAEPRSAEHALARRALLHASHLSRTPPAEALADLEAGLAREFARWEAMFPDVARASGP
ncbi:MAG TPA: glycosyltransferase family 2 protein [Opitutaceae bacterium]|nr:glycosyltransferase family 2 protein [Opitutaceae bacterium]